MIERTRCPLDWPSCWRRTPRFKRRLTHDKVSFTSMREAIARELQRQGGSNIVVSSNVPLNRDGTPSEHANPPNDSGVAVYWTDAFGHDCAIPCDEWATVSMNAISVLTTIVAMGRVESVEAKDRIRKSFWLKKE